MGRKILWIGIAACLSLNLLANGQTAPVSKGKTGSLGVGDTLDNPPPLANFSSAFKPGVIEAAMHKVGELGVSKIPPLLQPGLDLRRALRRIHGRRKNSA
jgi:hypothetical protein